MAAMIEKNLWRAPMAEDVCYESPLSGEPIRGRHYAIHFPEAYLPLINEIHVDRYLDNGDYVAIRWRADTTFGPLAIVYLCRVELGKITELQAFYDPRGFLARMGDQRPGQEGIKAQEGGGAS